MNMLHNVLKFLFLVVFLLNESYPSPVEKDSCELKKFSEVVIIDAGSTGTRVAYYKFELDQSAEKSGVSYDKIKIREIKTITKGPAMSSYDSVDKFPALRTELNKMIAAAEESLSKGEQCIRHVPLYFRATAGVRAMTMPIRSLLITEIRKVLLTTSFKKPRSVAEIISGKDEGIFSYVSLNVLRSTAASFNQYALLELGGASTQVVSKIYSDSLKNEATNYFMFGQTINFFAKSYLNMGSRAIQPKFFDIDGRGPCIHKDAVFDYTFGSVSKSYRGMDIKNIQRYSICSIIAKNIINPLDPVWQGVKKPGKIQAIRGFYFAVLNANSIINSCATNKEDAKCKKKEFTKTLTELEADAKAVCTNPSTANKFLITTCIDLVYTLNVLKYGYKIPSNDAPIIFANEVNGYDVSWSFGIGFSAAYQQFSSTKNIKGDNMLLASVLLIMKYLHWQ